MKKIRSLILCGLTTLFIIIIIIIMHNHIDNEVLGRISDPPFWGLVTGMGICGFGIYSNIKRRIF
jgi:hypothetical protein